MLNENCFIAFPAGKQEAGRIPALASGFAALYSLHKRRSKLRKKNRLISQVLANLAKI